MCNSPARSARNFWMIRCRSVIPMLRCVPRQRLMRKTTPMKRNKHRQLSGHPKANPGRGPKCNHAFTRLELLVVVLVVAGLGCVALPALGASAARSRLAQCFNNLRVTGGGFHRWIIEANVGANERFPWQFNTAEGGTRNSPFVPNAWIHFSVLSNHLDPRVLVCPSDYAKRIAPDFNGPAGFTKLGQRDATLSYFMGSDTSPNLPRTILCGDRNLTTSGIEICGTIGAISHALNSGDSSIQWTNLHGATGNLLFVDGSVSTSTSQDLRSAITRTGDANGDNHILIPTLPSIVPE
jgi:prepilin-type processing-associated H-X9-DG protein